MQFLIKDVNLVSNNMIKKVDVLTKNDKIVAIDEKLKNETAIILNCAGLFMLPGLVDMHVHLREPGFCEKETIKTGCDAATAGGFSTICCMPNTKPVIDCEQVFNFVKQKSKNCYVNLKIIVAITKNLLGTSLTNFEQLANLGAVAFSDDGHCVENDDLMLKALKTASKLNKLVISHCENSKLSKHGLMNEGKISKLLNLKGISNFSESLMVAKHIKLAKKLNCKIHIAHVSTAQSVMEIKKAKQQGVSVSAETCPHYFFFNDEALIKKNANFKINPPLRSEFDRKMVEQALICGTIDCITTDHAPHTTLEKQNFENAPFGAIGLETSLASVLTHFFHTKKLNLNEIVNLMSLKPNKILNLPPNYLKIGAFANFTIVDIFKKWVVRGEKFKSKSNNTPFEGKTLTGKVVKTFFKGVPVFSDY